VAGALNQVKGSAASAAKRGQIAGFVAQTYCRTLTLTDVFVVNVVQLQLTDIKILQDLSR